MLTDVGAVTRLAATSPVVRTLAERSGFLSHVRRALVAETPEQFGVGRMFASQVALEGGLLDVFYRRDEALAWLGIEKGAATE